MPLYKTSLNILNTPKPIEVELELNSFAGGENTIGEDFALKNNEGRLIQNWESLSLGGMERSRGETLYSSAPKTIKTPVHSVGAGLSDLTSSGTYSGSVTSVFTVKITTAAGTDKFKWKKDSGAYSAEISCSATPILMSDGVYIAFAATTGHVLNDEWTVTAKVYTGPMDLLVQHVETTSTRLYGVIEGDLLYANGASLTLTDSLGFTTGILCHAVSKGDKLWITNATDNLKYKTFSGTLTTPAGVPAAAHDRIYYFKSRLIAEGSSKTVQGSRAGTGYWTAADAWSATNDAWSIDLPDYTQGCAIGFPSGDYVSVFTRWGCYLLTNFPAVTQSPIIGSHGCSFPYTIAIGSEGLYFLSQYPTFGVFLWNGTMWTNLTINHNFIDSIDTAKRIYGIYRDNKYYLFYCETGSGVSVPNRVKVYNSKFGRWMTRSVNASVGDTLGYPCCAAYTSNEFFVGSSGKPKMYQFEDANNSDNGYDTQALFRTKNFSSRDFGLASGGEFPIDDVRLKLIKFVVTYYGTAGNLSLLWRADNGRATGSQTVTMLSSGDKLNTTFVVNTSLLSQLPPDKTATRSFKNSAVGRRFQFDILHNGQGERPRIKRIKIYANLLEEA